MPDILLFLTLPFVWLLIVSAAFVMLSLFMLRRGKENIALLCLFAGAFCCRLFVALQDPFLNNWDEGFHALVARNMMDNPFSPTLIRNPVTGYAPYQWTCNHIWLHKQPLFMWQIALSMKLFGVSAYAVRYPSVLMGALMVVMLYSITKTLTGNKMTAWIAALIFCFNGFHLGQTSGVIGMDHNDIAFGCYVLASIWAFTRYTTGKKVSFALLIGLFAGGAVLIKWLTGLVMFSGWAVTILLSSDPKIRIKETWHFLAALTISIAVFLPWQIYISRMFPIEAHIEYQLNAQHISEVVENHGGTIFYYLDHFTGYFGEVGWLLVPGGFVILFLLIRKNRVSSRETGIALIAVFSVVYVFFSYIVKTKMEGYFFMIAPIACLFMAISITEISAQLRVSGWAKAAVALSPCLVTVVVIGCFNPDTIRSSHDPNDPVRIQKTHDAAVFKDLKKHIPPDVQVVFNAGRYEEISAMFYNPDLRIFSDIIEKAHTDKLLNKHVAIAVFGDKNDKNSVPDYLANQPLVHVIYK